MSWRLNSPLETPHLLFRLVNIFSLVFPQPPSPHAASWESRQEFWTFLHLYKTQQTPDKAMNLIALPAHQAEISQSPSLSQQPLLGFCWLRCWSNFWSLDAQAGGVKWQTQNMDCHFRWTQPQKPQGDVLLLCCLCDIRHLVSSMTSPGAHGSIQGNGFWNSFALNFRANWNLCSNTMDI